MSRRAQAFLWGQWRERQRESGPSIVEFRRKEGVSPVTFHTWRRKLRGQAPERPSANG